MKINWTLQLGCKTEHIHPPNSNPNQIKHSVSWKSLANFLLKKKKSQEHFLFWLVFIYAIKMAFL